MSKLSKYEVLTRKTRVSTDISMLFAGIRFIKHEVWIQYFNGFMFVRSRPPASAKGACLH